MRAELIEQIQQLNPWLVDHKSSILDLSQYIARSQTAELLSLAWDQIWLILIGPRQAGKTTLGKYLCQQLLTNNRFSHLLYLNCDYLAIREWLTSPLFVKEALENFNLTNPILFIDEVQRLENPGLLLKAIADLKLPIKMLASGSSQLEIKSKVQETLTGRHLEALVLPLSYTELDDLETLTQRLIYGCYPAIVLNAPKRSILLTQLFQNYINKDIVEILKISKPDVLQKLVTLLAHSSGQLVNYTQLSNDCRVSTTTIYNYLSILEKTYVIHQLLPFVGNKRSEVTSNPVCYFLDNGFRNQALQNFASLDNRTDTGLLVESAVFQEIYKFKTQYFYDFNINFWRTTSGAEVDFILSRGENILPIEVKYRELKAPQITRSFRSFIQAYQPKQAIFVTKNFIGTTTVNNCKIHFIPLINLAKIFPIIEKELQLNSL